MMLVTTVIMWGPPWHNGPLSVKVLTPNGGEDSQQMTLSHQPLPLGLHQLQGVVSSTAMVFQGTPHAVTDCYDLGLDVPSACV